MQAVDSGSVEDGVLLADGTQSSVLTAASTLDDTTFSCVTKSATYTESESSTPSVASVNTFGKFSSKL